MQLIFDWVLEKVDGLAASWKDVPEDEGPDESQQLNDIDLFTLSTADSSITVHDYWLRHLEARVMGDAHPRKARGDEDGEHIGLVLEWLYGSIVSTSEKARESSKRQLHPHHPPDINAAWALLHAVRSLTSVRVVPCKRILPSACCPLCLPTTKRADTAVVCRRWRSRPR